MLDLDSPRWRELASIYGDAAEVPQLLRQLEANPNIRSVGVTSPEPWHTLWSLLYHQNIACQAAYAAVPHIVRIAALADDPPSIDYFCLPATVDSSGDIPGTLEFPADLADAYMDAIKRLPSLIPRLAIMEWDDMTARTIASGLVGIKGHGELSTVILEMTPDEIESYYEFKEQE